MTVICTDKTGTITKGEMTVTKVWVGNRVIQVSGVGYTPIGDFTSNGKLLEKDEVVGIDKLLEISALCTSGKVEPPSDRNRSWGVIGDPTDGALLIATLKYGVDAKTLLVQKPVIRMIPFNSERKRMTTIHQSNDKILVYTKGAPRSVCLCARR